MEGFEPTRSRLRDGRSASWSYIAEKVWPGREVFRGLCATRSRRSRFGRVELRPDKAVNRQSSIVNRWRCRLMNLSDAAQVAPDSTTIHD